MPRRTRDRSPKPRRTPFVLDRLNPDAAGIDCGSAEHFVAVPPDRDGLCVRSFPTFTADLYRLADWLTVCRIRSVAMEATGVDSVHAVGTLGDTVLDLQAGNNACVKLNIGALSGAHSRAKLEAEPHTHLIASVADLPRLLAAL